MTKEYIERGVAIQALKDYALRVYDIELDCPDQFGGSSIVERYCEGIYESTEIISDGDHVPAADVVEVKHGRWKEQVIYICNSDDVPISPIGLEYKCSECGRTENKQEPYCHCGAKMDGE